tara:strand:+ start:2942 stop:4603 length:1662 start_codon:yes stop_codon:yes gene_type:complete
MFLKRFLIILFLSSVLVGQEKNNFVVPLDIPLRLSGTFGELRGNHFHAGIDIKTQGRQGFKIKSVKSGKVNRIRVSTSGYGKSLYIEHLDGTTSVYAHLKKFAPKIEAYVKEKQYLKESYTIQLFPKENELTVDQGEFIGYSGNTGGSNGPHLHFEIRNSSDQSPINPMLFPIKIEDTQRPQIQNFYLFSLQGNNYTKKEYPLIRKNDSVYTIATIKAGGILHVGLRLFDRQNYSYNKNGIYRASVSLNGKEEFSLTMDKISFKDSNIINLMIDYKTLKKEKKMIQRFAVLTETKFSFVDSEKSNGEINIQPNKSYQLLLEVTDFKGNSSYVEAYILGIMQPQMQQKTTTNLVSPNKAYLYEFESSTVYFPKQTFYKEVSIHSEQVGDTLKVGEDFIPLKKPFEISFNSSKMDSLTSAQSFIGKLDTKGKPKFLSNKIKNGMWEASSKTLGSFMISRDSIAPKIAPLNFRNKQWLSNHNFLKLKIDDDYTGVKSYRGEINGQWILLEYEPKNKTLIYNLSDLTFDKVLHQLNVEVEDFVENKTEYSIEFYRKK